MATYVSVALRKLVAERANKQCEYCLLPQEFAHFPHEPDHIIPTQHDGLTVEDNLAHACFVCNRNQGPNVGSFDPVTGKLTPFFHPRKQSWSEHFQLHGGEIIPLTAEARVTVKIFRLNEPDRVDERLRLLKMEINLLAAKEEGTR